jgi:hypothetical protein
MLNEQPRELLQMMIERYGLSICDNPNRFEKILRDLCPDHKLEVNLLVIALRENVVADLLKPPANVSTESLFNGLSYRLQVRCGVANFFANWAVKSWTSALQTFLPKAQTKTLPVVENTITSSENVSALSAKSQAIGKFIVQDGVATDTQTHLIWLRFSYGQTWKHEAPVGQVKLVSWHLIFDAISHFNQQGGYAGLTDWRLPTADELKTLIDRIQGKQGHCIDKLVFPGEVLDFWSFLPSLHGHRDAWVINFGNGYEHYEGEYNSHALRLVRGRKRYLAV